MEFDEFVKNGGFKSRFITNTTAVFDSEGRRFIYSVMKDQSVKLLIFSSSRSFLI